jgi:hypothetical protein
MAQYQLVKLTNFFEHRIYIKDVPPIKTRHRPINPGLEKNLREQLDKWIEHDVIEPSSSPWSFAMVGAPKKRGALHVGALFTAQ